MEAILRMQSSSGQGWQPDLANSPVYGNDKWEAGSNANVRELTIIALVCCFSLGLAWAYEADLFAMFFAAAAAIAGVEAVRRSL
jgi:hypothetical protein